VNGAARPPTLGSSGLLRVAGLPVRVWLAASSEQVFEQVRLLEAAEAGYLELAGRVAADLGERLVPCPALPATERRAVLAWRRALHRGERVAAAEGARLAAIARRLRPHDRCLHSGLGEVARRAGALAGLEEAVRRAVTAEETRLARLPWELMRATPELERLARDTNPEALEDLARRLRQGEGWDAKRVRQRSDYLWRLIDRAATKATPRAWCGQVALLPVAPNPDRDPPLALALATGLPGPERLAGLRLRDGFASEWLENVFERRRSRTRRALEQGDPTVCLAVTPLRRDHDGQLHCWVADPDPDARGNLNEVRLRRTGLLDAVVAALRPGAVPLGTLEAALAPTGDGRERSVLRAFLAHLAGLGVLEVAAPPLRLPRSWGVAAAEAEGAGFLDVYRRVSGPLPAEVPRRLEVLVRHAFRVAALAAAQQRANDERGANDERAADGGEAVGESIGDAVGEEPRPLLELLDQRIHQHQQARGSHQRHGWPRPDPAPDPDPGGPASAGPGAAWARLLAWIGGHADDHGATPLDLDPALLDRLGVPEAATALDWPLDVLLRPLAPGAGAEAVLDHVATAGILDARFVPTLQRLHGQVPHADAQRRFLAALEERTGATFVELLGPPLNPRAANAVRRPLLTRAWTGDPDLDGYCDAARSSARYIPLDAITLRRHHGQLVAEADGRLLWPVYHASRTLQPPWHHFGELLLRAGPQPRRHTFAALALALDAFPERQALPRISVAGGLVLSCAQWRTPAEPLWEPAAPAAEKARALWRLRQRLGLPRYVFVAGHPLKPPLPVDLESLRAVHTIDRAIRTGFRDLLLVEALPAPDQLPVHRAAHPEERYAAELLLRMPDEAAEAVATRAARSLGERWPLPRTHHRPPLAAARASEPWPARDHGRR